MKLENLYNDIISKEPYNDMDIFFSNHDNFEEVPLISRDSRISRLSELLKQNDTLEFLIGLSVFLLNSIHTISKIKNINKEELFTAITFTSFKSCRANHPIIPNIFIYPNQKKDDNLQKTLMHQQPNKISAELTTIKNHFIKCNLDASFIFYESRFHDHTCNDEFIRIFAIPKQPDKQ